MNSPIWQTEFGDGPLVACAIHDGHEVRAGRRRVPAARRLRAALRRGPVHRRVDVDRTDADRRTAVAVRARFQPAARQGGVHRARRRVGARSVEMSASERVPGCKSLAAYDDFYAHLRLSCLERLVARHGRVVVFDLHSYNHIRGGRGGEPADRRPEPGDQPGHGLDAARRSGRRSSTAGSPKCDRYDYLGRRLDVRENVKFFGGNLPAGFTKTFRKRCARWPSK